MTASEASYVGLAKQTAKGTPNVTDNDFGYFLFTEGGVGPQNVVIPLDQEVGGGAMLRGLAKVGVTATGAFTMIPRPTVLGRFLLGALGECAAPAQEGATTAYHHVFSLPSNQFSAPYFTLRSNPGGIWGESFQDCRVAALSLNWRAADYVRGAVAFMGGLPTPNVSTATWAPAAKVDGGPQFLAPVSKIEVPDATALKVLSGQVTFGLNIPLEEQWITGSYSPDDFDINSRAVAITLGVKITDKVLYNKCQYDPADGAAWTAAIFREADLDIEFISDIEAGTGFPYSLKIEANGASDSTANVVWSAQPIGLRAGRQVTMAVTGVFLASSIVAEPVTVTLTNAQTTQY